MSNSGWLLLFLSCFFFLIDKEVYLYIYIGTKIVAQGIQDVYTYHQEAQRREGFTKQEGQQEPNQLKKLTRVKEPSFINILVSNQRKQTKVLAFGSKALHHQKKSYSLTSKPSKRCIRVLLSEPSCTFCP